MSSALSVTLITLRLLAASYLCSSYSTTSANQYYTPATLAASKTIAVASTGTRYVLAIGIIVTLLLTLGGGCLTFYFLNSKETSDTPVSNDANINDFAMCCLDANSPVLQAASDSENRLLNGKFKEVKNRMLTHASKKLNDAASATGVLIANIMENHRERYRNFAANIEQRIPSRVHSFFRIDPAIHDSLPQLIPIVPNPAPEVAPVVPDTPDNLPQLIPIVPNPAPEVAPVVPNTPDSLPQLIPVVPNPAPRVFPVPDPAPKVDPVPNPAPKVDPVPDPAPKVDPVPNPAPKVDPVPDPAPKVVPKRKAQRPASSIVFGYQGIRDQSKIEPNTHRIVLQQVNCEAESVDDVGGFARFIANAYPCFFPAFVALTPDHKEREIVSTEKAAGINRNAAHLHLPKELQVRLPLNKLVFSPGGVYALTLEDPEQNRALTILSMAGQVLGGQPKGPDSVKLRHSLFKRALARCKNNRIPVIQLQAGPIGDKCLRTTKTIQSILEEDKTAKRTTTIVWPQKIGSAIGGGSQILINAALRTVFPTGTAIPEGSIIPF